MARRYARSREEYEAEVKARAAAYRETPEARAIQENREARDRARYRRRNSRKHPRRKATINIERASKKQRLAWALEDRSDLPLLPLTRADCADVPRPCPFVTCRWHLYLDVNAGSGNITLNFPDLEVDELQHSCCLDVADEGGVTLEQAGAALNITRERARQLEASALVKLRVLTK